MAAAVEAPWNGGAPFQVGVLLHRQPVHIGAQANAFAAFALALEHADDAGAAKAAMHLDAPLRELLGDNAGGAHLLEPDLGMGVEVAPNGGQFGGVALDAVDGRHVSLYPVERD